MLEIKNLNYRYEKSSDGLNRVFLNFKENDITGVIGSNGSGKTTLFKLISNFLPPPKNTIFFNQIDISKMPLKGQSHISVCFDLPSVINKMTILENLSYYNILFKKKEDNINEILQDLNLVEYKNYRIKNLSYGLKQRVNIAAMLLRDTDVLIFDEPMNGLDPQSIVILRELFKKYKEKGKSIIVSAHIISEIEKIADKIIIFKEGSVIFNDINPQKSNLEFSLISCEFNEQNLIELKKLAIQYFVKSGSSIKFFITSEKLAMLDNLKNHQIGLQTSLLEDIYYKLSL